MPRTGTDQLWRILPPSATDLERDVCAVAPFDHVLGPFVPKINTAKHVTGERLFDETGEPVVDEYGNLIFAEPPIYPADDWLPWLHLEYGISDLAPYLPDPRELLVEGLAFNRERGTAAGMKRAMRWLGYENAGVREREHNRASIHFAEYQILLGEVPVTVEELCTILRVARIAQPVRGRLRRVLHGWDRSHFVLDESRWGARLDHYSGVRVNSLVDCLDPHHGPLWASFGRQLDFTPDTPVSGEITILADYYRENRYNREVGRKGWPHLDYDYPGSFYPRTAVVGEGRASTRTLDAERRPTWANQLWQQSEWGLNGTVGSGYTRTYELFVTESGEPVVDETGDPIAFI